jgi:5-(carboxyamino)imidazole ribonucleotide mutase
MADTPLVGIIMGSKSDMGIMEDCAKQLEELGVAYELVVASAHRNPDRVHEGVNRAERGSRSSSRRRRPPMRSGAIHRQFVISVLMKTSDPGGPDSLLDGQMPSGVPTRWRSTVRRTPPSSQRILALSPSIAAIVHSSRRRPRRDSLPWRLRPVAS